MKWIIGSFLALTITLLGLNTAFALMRLPSDIAVVTGLGIIVALACGWIYAGMVTYRYINHKMVGAIALLVLGAASTGCSERIDPGYVGIVVNQWGEDRGVDSYPVQTGRIWYNPISTSVLQYPYFMQTYELKGEMSIVVNDKDGLRIAFPIGVGYSLDRTKVPEFYVKFRTEDIREFTSGFYKNAAQTAFNSEASKLTAEQIYGSEKQRFVEAARNVLNAQMSTYGVVTEQFSIIGDMQLPQQVVEAVNAKIQATQRAQQAENELRQTKAEAEKNIAQAEGDSRSKIIRAEADAKSNAIVAASLTSQLVEWQKVHKWNGVQPQVVTGGSGVSMLLSGPK